VEKSLKSIGLSSDVTKVFMSNLSNRGDLLVGDREKVVLLNVEGEILWEKKINVEERPYISEGGEVIVVKESDGLTAYKREGEVAWKFRPAKDAVVSWNTSRSGNYTAVALSNKLLLLERGEAVWEDYTGGTAHFLSFSANDKFIALATRIEDVAFFAPRDVTYITLYSIDGRRLWSTKVEGFPQGVYVTNGGELFVLLSKGRNSIATLIRGGSAMWNRELSGHWRAALSTPEGSLFAASGEGGTYIIDKNGNPVSHDPGIADGISDNGHLVLRGFSKKNPFFSSHIFLLSPEGEEIRRVEAINAVSTSISPNGKYIATITADAVYLLENQELIKIKEELIRKIDELLKR